jgi:hypothetical protein
VHGVPYVTYVAWQILIFWFGVFKENIFTDKTILCMG